MTVDYYILNPTGNITALVINNGIDEKRFPLISNAIMTRHKNVEQVGFVDFSLGAPLLHMAGGEFCGNATMSAAALFCELNSIKSDCLSVQVYGYPADILAEVNKTNDGYSCRISIDRPTDIKTVTFSIENKEYTFPIIALDGISHIIADLSIDENTAKELLKKYCDDLYLPAIGIMIYDKENRFLTPIVYVKSCNTVFCENSCGSGSCALCTHLTQHCVKDTEVVINQPGGTLKAVSSRNAKTVKLSGHVRIESHFNEKI